MKYIILILLILPVLTFWTSPTFKPMRKFVFKNQCPQTVWVGGFGVPLPIQTGWEMASGATKELMVDSNTVAIRFWARTGCQWKDDKFVC